MKKNRNGNNDNDQTGDAGIDICLLCCCGDEEDVINETEMNLSSSENDVEEGQKMRTFLQI